jgi:Flp pilus assembly protein TadD
MVGDSDVLLVASTGALDFTNIEEAWRRPGVAADLRDQFVGEPFELMSLFVVGPAELTRYAAGARVQTDDHMALEFSGPRAVGTRTSKDNAAQLRHLVDERGWPAAIRRARERATATEWRNRGAMLLAANDYVNAFEDYVRATTLDPTDAAALDGLVRTSVAAGRRDPALDLLKAAIRMHPRVPALRVATSRLLAAGGSIDEAVAAAREACLITPIDPAALEQLASILADVGDAQALARVAATLQQMFRERASSRYYAAAVGFLNHQYAEAVDMAQQALTLNPRYAAAENLLGAVHATLGHTAEAREAFHAALRLDARDSATYVNLGFLEMSSQNRAAAARYFAEALSLDPKSAAARQGVAQARR